MKTTIQHDKKDCGAACLHMIAEHYGYSQPIAKFRELTKTDKNGTSVYGLITAADGIGLKGEAMSGSIEELIKGINTGEVVVPFIAHIITDKNTQHFVVVSDYKNGCFTIHDPSRGKVKTSQSDFTHRWTGCIVTFGKTADFRKQRSHSTGLLRFFGLLTDQLRRIAMAVILSIIISLVGITGAFVFHLVIDNCPEMAAAHVTADAEAHEHAAEASGHECEESGTLHSVLAVVEHVDQHRLTVIFLSLISLYLLASVLQYLRGRLVITVSRNIDLNLTLPYFFSIVDMPVGLVQQRQTGDYLSRFSDAATIRDAISTTTLTLILDSLMTVGCGAVLYIQNRQLFFISAAVILVYALVVLLFRHPLSEANRKLMEANSVVQSYLKESVDGISTVKAAMAEHEVKDRFRVRFDAFVNAVVKKSRLGTTLDTIVTATQSIGVAVILCCGFKMVLNGSMTLGSLISFYALLSFFIEPVKNLIGLQPTLQTATVAAERLSDILDASSENASSGEEPLMGVQTWSAEHVDFRYGNDELTLRDVSLSVRSGERVAIVGESGCGKTTLAKLFLRFHDPENGEVTADGVPLKEYRLSDIRREIAYIEQDAFLFSGTIRDNLTMGNQNIREDEIVTVCESVGAYDFIRKLPLGLDSFLEENGTNLSGGQRQLLAIARALLKHPKLLIMDEATSNLDPATEARIKSLIASLGPEVACIIKAHRLSTIKSCDRIYVMQDGRIVEAGLHEELLEKEGSYAALLKHQ